MSRRNTRPVSKHHVLIYDEDWDYLTRRYGPGSPQSGVGISGAIRAMVHQRVLGLKAIEQGTIDQLPDSQRDTGEEGLKL